MKLDVPAGNYVVAVSGGVDSVVLLDMLRLQPGLRLIVAHFDHGIRDESPHDRRFVATLARRYKLPFVYDEGQLGVAVGEASARQARYRFLRKVQRASSAEALITAHHQDDVLETVIINLLRGTGRKGLSSLSSGAGVIRPLLDVPKSEILDYAQRHHLDWHEDSTNSNTQYLRNKIRHQLMPQWQPEAKAQLLAINRRMQQINTELDAELTPYIGPTIDRAWFTILPHDVSKEVIAAWLRRYGVRTFDAKTLERLVIAAKVAVPGKVIDIVQGHRMQIHHDHLALTSPER